MGVAPFVDRCRSLPPYTLSESAKALAKHEETSPAVSTVEAVLLSAELCSFRTHLLQQTEGEFLPLPCIQLIPKRSQACLMSNIAEIGANVERKIGKASVRDAIIGTGVAIDKMLALTGQTPAVAVQVVLPTEAEVAERRACHKMLDAITSKLCGPIEHWAPRRTMGQWRHSPSPGLQIVTVGSSPIA